MTLLRLYRVALALMTVALVAVSLAYIREHRQAGQLQGNKSIRTLDNEVLSAVLQDLLSTNSKDSPVAIRGSLPKAIVFTATPAHWHPFPYEMKDPYQKEL